MGRLAALQLERLPSPPTWWRFRVLSFKLFSVWFSLDDGVQETLKYLKSDSCPLSPMSLVSGVTLDENGGSGDAEVNSLLTVRLSPVCRAVQQQQHQQQSYIPLFLYGGQYFSAPLLIPLVCVCALMYRLLWWSSPSGTAPHWSLMSSRSLCRGQTLGARWLISSVSFAQLNHPLPPALFSSPFSTNFLLPPLLSASSVSSFPRSCHVFASDGCICLTCTAIKRRAKRSLMARQRGSNS